MKADSCKIEPSAEDVADIAEVITIKAAIKRGEEEYIPLEFAKRLISGDEHPVRVYRELRNLKAKELAKKAGITSSYLSTIETFKRNAGLKVYRKLAKALNVTLEDILPPLDDDG